MSDIDNREERTRSQVWSDDEGSTEPRVLAFWDGGFASRSLQPGARLVVGRSQECDIRIDHGSVSRKHLVVHAGPPVMIEDLASANGTRMAGEELPPNERVPVAPGTLVEVGSAMLHIKPAASQPSGRPSKRLPQPVVETPLANPFDQVRRLIELVAASSLSVILLGETGVGKDVTAQRIHQRSHRRHGPFVRINCAALAATLLESELFGHERGAFTGAAKTKPGLFEAASGGTIFLDEVGEMAIALQAKVLRAIESGEVVRVGSVEPRPIDVRFIAATNADLPVLVATGAFRGDLYFRLNGITIRLPPLRERRNEIMPLAAEFVTSACTRIGRPTLAITEAARAALESHDWPGNVRELRNVIERAVVLCGGTAIGPEHLILEATHWAAPGSDRSLSSPPTRPASFAPPPSTPPLRNEASPLRSAVETYERDRIIEALERASGNQTKAAALLGISRRTLISRLDQYALPRPRKKS